MQFFFSHVLLLMFLLDTPVFACWCSIPNTKTVRDLAAWHIAGSRQWWDVQSPSQPEQLIMEASVERQEIMPEAPRMPEGTLSMTAQAQHREVFLRVLRSYRGQTANRAVVITGMGGGDCGFDFESGRSYLVFAQKLRDGSLFTSICTGTARLEIAGTALRILRSEAPQPEDLLSSEVYYRQVWPVLTGEICGRIRGPDDAPAGGVMVDATQIRNEPFYPKVASDEHLSSADGTFCIRGIEPGKYVLSGKDEDLDAGTRLAGYYPTEAAYRHAKIFDIKASTRIHDIEFRLHKETLFDVIVTVIAPAGAEGIRVALRSSDRAPLSYDGRLDRPLTGDGTAYFPWVPAGKYHLTAFGRVPQGSQNGGNTPLAVNGEVDVTVSGNTEAKVELVSRPSKH